MNCYEKSYLKDKLTVIIPSHNRHKYLIRSNDYWGGVDFRILIMDSTEKPLNIKFSDNIEYHNLPDTSFAERISQCMKLVCTPYVVLCPDDDFQTEIGLAACVKHLETHNEYSAAQGNHIAFSNNVNKSIYHLNSRKRVLDINMPDLETRIALGFGNYLNWFWAVRRTNVMSCVYQALKDIKEGNFLELGVSMGDLAAGSRIEIPIFYQAREIIPESWGRHAPKITELLNDAKYSVDREHWESACLALISQLGKTDRKKANILFQSALNAYINIHTVNKNKKNIFRVFGSKVKTIFIVPVWRAIKKFTFSPVSKLYIDKLPKGEEIVLQKNDEKVAWELIQKFI